MSKRASVRGEERFSPYPLLQQSLAAELSQPLQSRGARAGSPEHGHYNGGKASIAAGSSFGDRPTSQALTEPVPYDAGRDIVKKNTNSKSHLVDTSWTAALHCPRCEMNRFCRM